MKLRAPRCNEVRSVTSLAARQACQSSGLLGSGPSAAHSSGAANTASTKPANLGMANLGMERDSLGHRPNRIKACVDGHEQKERAIADRANTRQGDVNAFSLLQAKPHQSQDR